MMPKLTKKGQEEPPIPAEMQELHISGQCVTSLLAQPQITGICPQKINQLIN